MLIETEDAEGARAPFQPVWAHWSGELSAGCVGARAPQVRPRVRCCLPAAWIDADALGLEDRPDLISLHDLQAAKQTDVRHRRTFDWCVAERHILGCQSFARGPAIPRPPLRWRRGRSTASSSRRRHACALYATHHRSLVKRAHAQVIHRLLPRSHRSAFPSCVCYCRHCSRGDFAGFPLALMGFGK